jgi:hypothetical protein
VQSFRNNTGIGPCLWLADLCWDFSPFLTLPSMDPLIAQILDSHTFDDARIPCQLVHTFSRNQTTAGATSETSPLDRLPAAG